MLRAFMLSILMLGLLLAGCLSSRTAVPVQNTPGPNQPAAAAVTRSPAGAARQTEAAASLPSPTVDVPDMFLPQKRPQAGPTQAPGLSRVDSQGMVQVDVKPVTLDLEADPLDFEVSLNTHSVDLSMDLVELSSLVTDTGVSVAPLSWDAPSGGHHVSGTLSFPGVVDGRPVLEGAKQISLVIRDVDAPERTFTWDLVP